MATISSFSSLVHLEPQLHLGQVNTLRVPIKHLSRPRWGSNSLRQALNWPSSAPFMPLDDFYFNRIRSQNRTGVLPDRVLRASAAPATRECASYLLPVQVLSRLFGKHLRILHDDIGHKQTSFHTGRFGE